MPGHDCCSPAPALQACYVVASKAVELFKEVSSRRKDYIAQPKANGYQSLHCTVQLPPVTVECEDLDHPDPEECQLKDGPTCELQIRTQSALIYPLSDTKGTKLVPALLG